MKAILEKYMNYTVKTSIVGHKPYLMAYKHYFPKRPISKNVIVFIYGAGHTMKVWEETPDGRSGWAPIFAQNGRELIILDWACASSDIYHCSDKEICSLTQQENLELIQAVLDRELTSDQRVIFFGWSMGGPQAFILATDIIPEKTVALLGYAATGPLNFYNPSSESEPQLDLSVPLLLSRERIDRICNSPLFPADYKEKYIKDYLVPFSPRMAAIQGKAAAVKDAWGVLIVKNPKNIPPTLLVNGSLDKRHLPEKEILFKEWLMNYQKDISFVYVDGFSHLGMICRGNEKVATIYLEWLRKRGL